jgi:hypothetical protein
MDIAMEHRKHSLFNRFSSTAILLAINFAVPLFSQSSNIYDIPLKNSNRAFRHNNIINGKGIMNTLGNQRLNGWPIHYSPDDEYYLSASGEPISIGGFDSLNADNIKQAASAFLNAYRSDFADAEDDLKITQSVLAGGVWYVRFSQYIDEVPVLNSYLSLRISPDAKVFYLNSNIKRKASALLTNFPNNALKNDQLQSFALKDLGGDFKAADKGVYIIPIYSDNKLVLRYAQKFIISSEENLQSLFTYIDMESGETLWRQSLINDAKVEVAVNGSVIPKDPTTPPVMMKIPDFFIKHEFDLYQSDYDGVIKEYNIENLAYTFNFQGPWVKIETDGIKPCSGSGVLSSDAKQSIMLDDSNSNIYARTLFYHTNLAHKYIKSIEPSFTYMDKQITLKINNKTKRGKSINAFSDSKTGDICFDGIDSIYRYVESPSILYHEYGHSIVSMLYRENDPINGLTNAAVSEAFADMNAAFMTDNPLIGENSRRTVNGKTYIRTIKNNMIYPDSLDFSINDPHENSRIMSGAYWDLREIIGLDKIRKLTHFIKYSLINDSDLGLAFSKWFYETLIRDDDDNNLKNGVPDADAIIKTFNKHKIGLELYLNKNFVHEQTAYINDTLNPYPIMFSIPNDSLILSKIDEFKLMYKINDGAYSEILMKQDKGVYTASIPPQKPGTIVYYYFSSKSIIDSTNIALTNSIFTKEPFKMGIGFEVAFSDDFNGSKPAWSKVDDKYSNDSMVVSWECAVPEKYSYMNLATLQPNGGRSGYDDKCWVTGATAPTTDYRLRAFWGASNLISPVFDLSTNKNPIISFWFYTTVIEQTTLSKPQYKLIITLSEDGGSTWKKCDSIQVASFSWQNYSICLAKYISKFDNVKIAIKAVNTYQIQDNGKYYFNYYYEALIDDFEILKPIESKKTDVESDAYAIEIYPNPTKDILYINTNSDMSNASIELLDIEGRVVYNENAIKENPIKIDCSNITKGAYFLKITNNGKSISKPLIISR